MSVSPSFPQGAPSLAEVLITRTFAKPTNPFVDGEFLQALEHADDGEPKRGRARQARLRPGLGTTGQASEAETHSAPRAGTRIDVRV